MSIQEIVLECIPKTRGLTESELTARYTARCDANKIMPLWGQLATALRNLRQSGKVKLKYDSACGERRVHHVK